MNSNVMEVQCGKCRECFDIPYSYIIEINSYGNPNLSTKYPCPNCGKNHKDYFDPHRDSEALATIRKNIFEQQQLQKAQAPISCPSCGSTQHHAGQKGFSFGKALAGSVVTGGTTGLLAGFLGSNKVMLSCLKCGKQWKSGT